MGLPPDETFWVPDDVLEMYRQAIPRGQAARSEWEKRLSGLDGRPRGMGHGLGRRGPTRTGRRSCRSGPTPARRWPPATRSTRPSTPSLDDVPGLVAGGGRPDRQHRDQARRHRAAGPRAPRGPGHRLRRARARHGRGHQRHEPARRRHPHRRDVLRVQRLHARLGPPGRPFRGQGHLLLEPRLGRARARTARRISRSSNWRPCGPCPACGSSAPPTPTSRPTPCGSPSNARARRP